MPFFFFTRRAPSRAPLRRWRGLVNAVATALLLSTQTACVVVAPNLSTEQAGWSFSDTPLGAMKGGGDFHLLQSCHEIAYSADAPKPASQTCERPLSTLVQRPAGWRMADEASSVFKATPTDAPFGFSGSRSDGSLPVAPGVVFERPASASRGTRSEWIGVWEGAVGNGLVLVWTRPGAGDEAPRYESVNLFRGRRDPPVRPALVARDGDQVWLFAEHAGPCDGDICFTVPQALGVDAAELPEALRRPFMLFHADTGASGYFKRVFSDSFSRYLDVAAATLPAQRVAAGAPARPFAFDFANAAPARKLAPYQADLLCNSRTRTLTNTVMVLPVPMPVKESSHQSERFMGCQPTGAAQDKWLPAPRAEPAATPAPEPSDGPIRPHNSSYYCETTPVAGQREEGGGPHGCYFVLRDPVTHAALPRTPYLVAMTPEDRRQDARASTFKGTTDDAGRTARFRSAQPLRLWQLRVSRRVDWPAPPMAPGGDLRAADAPVDAAKAGDEAEISLLGRRLVRPTDGGGIGGQPYEVNSCDGTRYEGVSDEQGWTVAFEPGRAGRRCVLRYVFGGAVTGRRATP